MLIRDYLDDDFTSLITFWDELSLNSQERGDSREVIDRTLRHGGRLLIMQDPETNEIIGSSWMTSDGRRIYLHHFGIKPAFQRQGLGLKLALASLEHVKSKGLQVKLEVHKENFPAKRLYEKAGFFAFTEYDIYMKRRFDLES